MLKILIIIGTRPELIKMAILYKLLSQTRGFDTILCLTGQHNELIDDSLLSMDIKPEIRLSACNSKASLAHKMSTILEELQKQVDAVEPDLVLVQGDTLSALCGATVAFLNKIRLGHVEAGLRTHVKDLPFPEESFRRQITTMADIHFAPTERAAQNLLDEGISQESIHITGNTGIDALMMIGAESQGLKALNGDLADFIERVKTQGRKLLLLTMHRRESQSGFIQDIVDKLIGIVERNKLAIVCIEHPNPNSKIQLKKETDGSFAFLSPSMPYDVFIELMKLSDLILTDSGGIQEEAPALGKAVLVLRQETERRECLDGIHWSLFDPKDLEASILRMLQKKAPINKAFGDGNASKRIVAVLKNLQGSQA